MLGIERWGTPLRRWCTAFTESGWAKTTAIRWIFWTQDLRV